MRVVCRVGRAKYRLALARLGDEFPIQVTVVEDLEANAARDVQNLNN
jgi:hypothetical protein